MKKILSVILIFVFIFTLFSCSGYVSSYSAYKMNTANTTDHCHAVFEKLEGTYVIKVKKSAEAFKLYASAELDTGGIRVYCDAYGEKAELFEISSGESFDGEVSIYLEAGSKLTTYIIIETFSKSTGSVYIDYKKS